MAAKPLGKPGAMQHALVLEESSKTCRLCGAYAERQLSLKKNAHFFWQFLFRTVTSRSQYEIRHASSAHLDTVRTATASQTEDLAVTASAGGAREPPGPAVFQQLPTPLPLLLRSILIDPPFWARYGPPQKINCEASGTPPIPIPFVSFCDICEVDYCSGHFLSGRSGGKFNSTERRPTRGWLLNTKTVEKNGAVGQKPSRLLKLEQSQRVLHSFFFYQKGLKSIFFLQK